MFSAWLRLHFPVIMAAGWIPREFRSGKGILDLSFGLRMAFLSQKGIRNWIKVFTCALICEL